MMNRDLINETQYKFRATTRSATTAAAVLRTLGDDAEMLVAPDHIFACMMPDVLDRVSYAPDVVAPMHTFQTPALEAMYFVSEVSRGGAFLTGSFANDAHPLSRIFCFGMKEQVLRALRRTSWQTCCKICHDFTSSIWRRAKRAAR